MSLSESHVLEIPKKSQMGLRNWPDFKTSKSQHECGDSGGVLQVVKAIRWFVVQIGLPAVEVLAPRLFRAGPGWSPWGCDPRLRLVVPEAGARQVGVAGHGLRFTIEQVLSMQRINLYQLSCKQPSKELNRIFIRVDWC